MGELESTSLEVPGTLLAQPLPHEVSALGHWNCHLRGAERLRNPSTTTKLTSGRERRQTRAPPATAPQGSS